MNPLRKVMIRRAAEAMRNTEIKDVDGLAAAAVTATMEAMEQLLSNVRAEWLRLSRDPGTTVVTHAEAMVTAGSYDALIRKVRELQMP